VITGEEEKLTAGAEVGTGRETTGIHRTSSQDTLHVNTEEYNWGLDYVREMGRRQGHQVVPIILECLKLNSPDMKWDMI
jgi:hypothetical protein